MPADTASPVLDTSPAQAHQLLQKGACTLIDVREPDEHARESIAGATLIPLSRFDLASLETRITRDKPVVIHCRSGRRSADACRLAAALSTRGYTISNLAGGIEAWKRDGLPVVTNTRVNSISVMRQVQLVIGLGLLAGSALAWFHDPRWLALTAFFGAGLTFAGATGTCALASLLGLMPWNKARSADSSDGSAGCCS